MDIDYHSICSNISSYKKDYLISEVKVGPTPEQGPAGVHVSSSHRQMKGCVAVLKVYKYIYYTIMEKLILYNYDVLDLKFAKVSTVNTAELQTMQSGWLEDET